MTTPPSIEDRDQGLQEFCTMVYQSPLADFSQLVHQYELQPPHVKILEEFDGPTVEDFSLSSLNRWVAGVDAVRVETNYNRLEAAHGMRMLSHLYPILQLMFYREIALALEADRRADAVRYTCGLNAFIALVKSRLAQEHFPYLGRAGLILQSYGATLTLHLPQLGLKLQSH